MTERERLIELLKSDSCESPMLCDPNCKYANLERCYEERTADYLLENGVIVPPVYVGGTVYEIRRKAVSPSGRETNCGICTISFLKHCINIGIELYVKGKPYVKSDFYRLGKTVFLTREEAEKALKEREENA